MRSDSSGLSRCSSHDLTNRTCREGSAPALSCTVMSGSDDYRGSNPVNVGIDGPSGLCTLCLLLMITIPADP
jgi:hypothetical protein